jgi:hypothetical protein
MKPPEPKFTDEERHTRFKDMACEVDASEQEADFERAFRRITNIPTEGDPPAP